MSIGICLDCGRPFYKTEHGVDGLNAIWTGIIQHNGHKLGLFELYDFKLKDGELYLKDKLVKSYGDGTNKYIHLREEVYDELLNYAKNAQ